MQDPWLKPPVPLGPSLIPPLDMDNYINQTLETLILRLGNALKDQPPEHYYPAFETWRGLVNERRLRIKDGYLEKPKPPSKAPTSGT